MRNHQHHTPRRGFTLLEMLIVIFIILMLAGIVAYNLIGTQEEAEENSVRIQISVFVNALETFRVEQGRWPSEEEGLAVLWSSDGLDEAAAGKWRKLVNEPAPNDRFGHAWIYHQPSELVEGEYYDIISVGRDGEEGTGDDITNHSLKQGGGSADSSDEGGLSPVESSGD